MSPTAAARWLRLHGEDRIRGGLDKGLTLLFGFERADEHSISFDEQAVRFGAGWYCSLLEQSLPIGQTDLIGKWNGHLIEVSDGRL